MEINKEKILVVKNLTVKYGLIQQPIIKNFNLKNSFNIKKLLSVDDSGKEKVFFSLLKNNREITEIYREKIVNKLENLIAIEVKETCSSGCIYRGE